MPAHLAALLMVFLAAPAARAAAKIDGEYGSCLATLYAKLARRALARAWT